MPSTDIDGTPIQIFGATEVRDMFAIMFKGDRDRWQIDMGTKAALYEKMHKFLEEPEVTKWLEEHEA